MIDLESHYFPSFDGHRLAWREMGEGRPVVLLHGFFSDAETNWIRYGHAEAIAAAGRRVVMPDLRAHGSSDRSHDPAAYAPDVLARDGHALIDYLSLTHYDLAGYSLGGRTVVRMLATGATPGRAVIAGMGLEGLLDTGRRAAHFRRVLTNLGTFERGTPEWFAEAFLKTSGGDPVAFNLLLDSSVDTPEAVLRTFDLPALVLAGVDDHDNGSGEALAAVLPDAVFETVPGNHMSAVTKAELGTAMAAFLRD